MSSCVYVGVCVRVWVGKMEFSWAVFHFHEFLRSEEMCTKYARTSSRRSKTLSDGLGGYKGKSVFPRECDGPRFELKGECAKRGS